MVPDITRLSEKEIQCLPEEMVKKHLPYRYFGAHVDRDAACTVFRVYLPEATGVFLIRKGNNWNPTAEPLVNDGTGIWSITVPGILFGEEYKYLIINENSYLPQSYTMARVDPFAQQIETHYAGNGSRNFNTVIIDPKAFKWTCKYLRKSTEPMSIYELHLSVFYDANYRKIAKKIVEHVGYLGFTHVQIMPPFQTPMHESWGYLVSNPYAIYNRHGSVDDFKYLVNLLHEHNIGVIIDIPLGFTIQDWDSGIAMIDGTDLYHHQGSKGWNNQWHSRIYNHRNLHVRDYLIGILTYVHTELGVDGARIDAVSSQIFYDYDRGSYAFEKNRRDHLNQDQWNLINGLGGDRHFNDRGYWLSEVIDFDALYFYRDLHIRIHQLIPCFFTIAEESRRVFHKIATPIEKGGLGFNYAQNMGQMHLLRKNLKLPTEQRMIQHFESIMIQKSEEKYVNALNTHDECANGKQRLITEIGNHIQLIGLAALCWFCPGAPMIFMGDEFGEEGWFDIRKPLDWNKTGPRAQLYQQQLTQNYRALNYLLQTEPALKRHERDSIDRIGSNNEDRWFAIIRWGSPAAGWGNQEWEAHKDDIIFVRSENHAFSRQDVRIYVPVDGEYKVIYNSIDSQYIGNNWYNQHDPYWSVYSSHRFISIKLAPFQNIALKLK
ncbi:MAG: alpha-amylase family glycosyl hydrolase [bacterium]